MSEKKKAKPEPVDLGQIFGQMSGQRPQQGGLDLKYYKGLVLKYRWLVIAPFCVAMVAGMALSVVLPKVYKSSTLILIQPQKVPKEYVQPLVSEEIESRISTMSQQILSRTNLEKIIDRFHLFSDPKYDDMYIEDKIADLRKRISVDVIGGKSRRTDSTEAFSISFKGSDPEKVMNITNALADRFIEENLKSREEEALGTNEFLEDQLQSMRGQLGDLEKKVEAFRTRNMGGLPEQLESNLRVLDRLQAELDGKNESLRDAKNRLMALDTQLAEANVIHQTIAGYGTGGPASADEDDPQAMLKKMRQALADMKTRYTDAHPEIGRLKSRVEQLEIEIENRPAPVEQEETVQRPLHPDLIQRQSLLKQQRQETRLEIESLTQEMELLLREIKRYQKLVDETPKKEHELAALKRDYENIKMTYNSLLERKMQAQLSVNLEKNKKGEQFRIIDRAKLPNKPSEPDMKKLFLLAVFAGLGSGGAFVFMMIVFNDTVTKRKDIEGDLGLPVLATIPTIYTKWQKAGHWTNNALSALAIIFALALCAGFAFFVLKGPEQTITLIRTYAYFI